MRKSLGANAAELACSKSLEAIGLTASKRGWPDFVAYGEDGEIKMIVEVKPRFADPLSPHQLRIMDALQRYGITVKRFDPETGFHDFEINSEFEKVRSGPQRDHFTTHGRPKNPDAVALGRRGGLATNGNWMRALSAAERSARCRKAAIARWAKKRKETATHAAP